MKGCFEKNVLPLNTKITTSDTNTMNNPDINKNDKRYVGFTLFDKDGNGVLDRNEWFIMLKNSNHLVDKNKANILFDKYDLDKNGVIDYKE